MKNKVVQFQKEMNYIWLLTEDGKIYKQELFEEENCKEIKLNNPNQ